MFGDTAAHRGRLRVKICGITNLEDARAAIAAGADALGFNCYPESKRYLRLECAAAWIAELPREIGKVAVVVNPSWEEARAIAALPYITALQLHGDESPEFCGRLAAEGVLFAKALGATDPAAMGSGITYSTDVIVLDSVAGSLFGGTGTTFPWRIASEFAATHPDLRIVLAGGLTPSNVADAVASSRPYGVDVTTGVESSPGRKDHVLLRRFIEAARAI